jgi:hypothetical protein
VVVEVREEAPREAPACIPSCFLNTRPNRPTAGRALGRKPSAFEDWTATACNYAVDAFIIDDQGVLTGHADIIAAEQSLCSLFGGVAPTLAQQGTFRDTVRVLDSLEGGWGIIPDRTTTYVVECDIITRQTVHGLIEFTGPPPS